MVTFWVLWNTQLVSACESWEIDMTTALGILEEPWIVNSKVNPTFLTENKKGKFPWWAAGIIKMQSRCQCHQPPPLLSIDEPTLAFRWDPLREYVYFCILKIFNILKFLMYFFIKKTSWKKYYNGAFPFSQQNLLVLLFLAMLGWILWFAMDILLPSMIAFYSQQ